MRRLAILPLVMLAFACNDSTLVQPEESASQDALARMGYGPRTYMLGGEGEWSWDGTLLPPDTECANAGGTFIVPLTTETRFVPFGPATGLALSCNNGPVQLFSNEVAIFRNGDELWIRNHTYLTPPEGYSAETRWSVEGGTGRFRNATGDGMSLATAETATSGTTEHRGVITR